MKTKLNQLLGNSTSGFVSCGSACIALAITLLNTLAEPRPVSAPWPESTLSIFGFDESYESVSFHQSPFGMASASVAESWSGYALIRDALGISPVAVPAVDAISGRKNIALDNGTMRFWFSPDWSSADAGGKGPGGYARLLELVGLNQKQPEVLWSLYLNAEGTALYFSGQGIGGQTDFLKAPVQWQAGEWHLVSVSYNQAGSSLSVDGEQIGAGGGVPEVAAWKVAGLGLVIGSDLAMGDSVAKGRFDELTIFDYWPDAEAQKFYYTGVSRQVALGPVGTEEEERAKQASLMAVSGAILAEDSGGNGPLEASYASNDLWLEITGVTNDLAHLIVHGTQPDVTYELLSKLDLADTNWSSEQSIIGAVDQDWTPTDIPTLGRTNLFLWAKSWIDSDGDGLPDWWELEHGLDPNNPDTGNTGVSDGYKDADGDGWNNLQEYQNGTNPNVFNTPPAPSGFRASMNTNGTSAILIWSPSPGNVIGYTIYRQDYPYAGFVAITNVSPNPTSFVDNSVPDGDDVEYEIEAIYSGGTSSPSEDENPRIETKYTTPAFIVRGTGGLLYLVVGSIPENVTAYRVYRTNTAESYYPLSVSIQSGYFPVYSTNAQQLFTPNVSDGFFDVPVTSFTNGVYAMSTAQVPYFGTYQFQVRALGYDGKAGNKVVTGPYTGDSFRADYYIPFLDGRTQIVQNVTFLLRTSQTNNPFVVDYLAAGFAIFYNYSSAPDYVFAGFHFYNFYENPPILSELQPFEENNYYRNFCYGSDSVGTNGFNTTGVGGLWFTDANFNPVNMFWVDLDPKYWFDTYGYITGLAPSMAPLLSNAESQWIYFKSEPYDWMGLNYHPSTTNYTVSSTASNIYGLKLKSVKWPGLAHPPQFPTANPGDTISNPLAPGGSIGDFFSEFDQPILSANSYYFARHHFDLLPGETGFNVTNATPFPLIVPAGQPFALTAWLKYSLANGFSGRFAYAEQYFDKAYKMTNGVVTTNGTGVLSPYGEFFPMEPGQVALVTMPDIDTGARGTGVVNVIKLQLDVNHDGVMDLSFAGPDNTSYERPFTFWLNNDFDRGHTVDFTDFEEDDVSSSNPAADSPGTPHHSVPDYAYQTINHILAIPCKRDLEDYARLWVVGVSNTLSSLPAGSTVELSWRNATGPTINLFQAADADGGNAYLLNETNADHQIDPTLGAFVGTLGPNQTLQLNECIFGNCWRGDHFIFCGVAPGKGELLLSIKVGTIVLAETSVWIEIKDIKEMYERWTVGDNGSIAPTNTAQLAVEDLPSGVTPFQYSYNAQTDTNTPYILHVHGWNMSSYDKDRYAETVFKRLYWQHYQGRFGSFRWPTMYNFPLGEIGVQAVDPQNYDSSEFQALKSGAGLRNLLTTLGAKYPGQVRLTAHSMGNAAAGQALRISGTNTPLVHTYVAMEAAFPSHTYDASATNRSLGMFDNGTPNRYAEYWTNGAACYFNGVSGAGRYIDFFNQDDWALAKWTLNHNTKPDYGYSYSAGNFFRGFTVLDFPGDTFELFSYCVEARCYALGAQPNVGGAFRANEQVDLKQSPFEFGAAHKGHSAQFRSTNMKRGIFWQTALEKMQLE